MWWFAAILALALPPPLTADKLLYCNGENWQKSSCHFHTIVLDGGSTGTRLHLHRFRRNPDDGARPFVVEDEFFRESKGGLSSFGEDVDGAVESVRLLLEEARLVIPEEQWSRTPVLLRATAGLRLLSEDLADRIIYELNHHLVQSGLAKVDGMPGAQILGGIEEGVYGWLTLNLLLEHIDSSAEPTAAVLDLGGGSTQITFEPGEENNWRHLPSGHHFHLDWFHRGPRQLFSHSFLGNGLIAARLGTLQLRTGGSKDSLNLKSACFPGNSPPFKWDYSMHEWSVSGLDAGTFASLVDCLAETRAYVEQSNIFRIAEHVPKDTPPHLLAYFFDRAQQSGLVDSHDGGEILVGDFYKAAEKACARSSDEISAKDSPHWLVWQCMDLSYIYSLLRNGYGFRDSEKVFVAKKLRSMEVSWALGLAHALASHTTKRGFDDEKLHVAATNTITDSENMEDEVRVEPADEESAQDDIQTSYVQHESQQEQQQKKSDKNSTTVLFEYGEKLWSLVQDGTTHVLHMLRLLS